MITDYKVRGAARSDMGKALSVVECLDAAGLKPETLFAGGGYPSVPSALAITEQQIEFIAPVNRGRLSDEIMGRDGFQFDSEGFATKCPMGHIPIGHRVISSNNKPRDTVGDFRLEITPGIRLRDQMYSDQQTPERKDRYKIRSGIETTNSELK